MNIPCNQRSKWSEHSALLCEANMKLQSQLDAASREKDRELAVSESLKEVEIYQVISLSSVLHHIIFKYLVYYSGCSTDKFPHVEFDC